MFKKITQRKNEKGFTLIELMIVVAIIGILAAIAIPQFAAYRMRAYNSAGVTDVVNLQKSEVMFFDDWLGFGHSEDTGAGTDTTATLDGPGTADIGISDTNQFMQIGLSNGVQLRIVTNAAVNANAFNAASKHAQGNRTYATDSDVTATFYKQDATTEPGDDLVDADAIAALTPSLEYTAALDWVTM